MLVWIGSALVAAFSTNVGFPYWPLIPRLRTDTMGFLAFGVSAVSLTISRYLELRRRADRGDTPARPAARPAGTLAVQAVADIAVLCATGMVIYLSLNAVTHPDTLNQQLTHLAPRPSEGTVRVLGLIICLAGVATRRYLRVTATQPAPAIQPDVAAWLDAATPLDGATRPAPATMPIAAGDAAPVTERDHVAVPPNWPAPHSARDPWQGNANGR
jgi:hypothetical protein